MLNVLFKKTHPNAVKPQRAYSTDVGFDLFAVEDIVLAYDKIVEVKTGLKMAIPSEWYGHIFPRSGLGKKGVTVYGGVIDPGYRDEVIVLLRYKPANDSMPVTMTIEKGSKFAQMIILPRYLGKFVETDNEMFNSETSDRGVNGFGSTDALVKK